MDLFKLNDTLGAYCRNNVNSLLSGVLVENESFNHFTPMVGVKDQAPIIDLEIPDILKPYNKNWDPAQAKPNPRIMQVRTCKVELELEPLKYHHTYLGAFLKPGTDPAKLPFEKFLMEKIIRAAKEQLELEGMFQGVYDAAGTTPKATMDGLNKVVEDAMLQEEDSVVPFVSGAITDLNAVEVLEGLFAKLPEKVQGSTPLKMLVSPKIKRWYDLQYREVYGGNTANTEFNRRFIDGTNCEIVPMPGLIGSGRVHIAPAWNLFFGTDLAGDMDVVRTQLDKWVIIVMMSFKIGVQIGSTRFYWCNDQA
jgi:hypothetical protein